MVIYIKEGEHKYQDFERDANFRAFKYFNKNVEGFYESASGTWDNTGWNFYSNPLLNEENKYIDYKNEDEMSIVRNSLSIMNKWYYMDPLLNLIIKKMKHK